MKRRNYTLTSTFDQRLSIIPYYLTNLCPTKKMISETRTIRALDGETKSCSSGLLDVFRPGASLTGVGMGSDGGVSNYPDQLSAPRRHFCQRLGTGSSGDTPGGVTLKIICPGE